ncbi:MAG TPA: winged helix-turn-helix domain-containing protein [Candidatus Eisenbacteria bacterium]|nr:winged helix-turn-helix domain-containing protein [Candidatus Eisenbacteria bacterium]
MVPDFVDTSSTLLVLVIGDVGRLPPPALAGMAAAGALVERFATPAAAAEWLNQVHGTSHVLRAGGLEIDREARTASCAGSSLDLTDQEFDLLLALAEAPSRTLAFRELDRRVWGDRHRRDTQRARSAVKRLRRKLAGTGCAIRAVRGFGFQLGVPPGEERAP